MGRPGAPAMVEILRAHTAPHHEALHHHPTFGPLNAPGLTETALRRALRAFAGLFKVIESARRAQDVWPEFALTDDLRALLCDLPGHSPPPPTCATFVSPARLLGALYVALGASFGRVIFAATVTRDLPGLHSAYLSRRPDQSLWRALQAALDQHATRPRTRSELMQGAKRAFAIADALATQQQPAPPTAGINLVRRNVVHSNLSTLERSLCGRIADPCSFTCF